MDGLTVGFEAAMARIRKVTGALTQEELARVLDIKRSSITAAKRRGMIPAVWLIKLFDAFGMSPTWVRFGTGAPFLCEDQGRWPAQGLEPAPASEPFSLTMVEKIAMQRRYARRNTAELTMALNELWPGYRVMLIPAGTKVLAGQLPKKATPVSLAASRVTGLVVAIQKPIEGELP